MKARRKRVSAALFISVLLFGIGATLLFYYTYYLVEYQEVPMDLKVENGIIGLNADKDALHFGAISPGNTGKRGMIITPAQDGRVVIRFKGNASAFVSPDRNNFVVRKDERFSMLFYANVPADASEGFYTGTVEFAFYRW